MKLPIQKLAAWMAALCALIIVLMPFHAFLTVWAASGIGSYTALRLWKEVLLLALFLGAIYIYCREARIRAAIRGDLLIIFMAQYVLLLFIAGLVAYLLDAVTLKSFLYGLLLDSRFLVFFAVTWLVTRYSDVLVRLWKRLLLVPAAVTVGFATLQYSVLPDDFLRHFGYGQGTIKPTITIDQKDAYARVQSTLRGPNPFGAYLVLIMSTLASLLVRGKKLDWRAVILFVASGLALLFTFSRSAWLGVFASLLLVFWMGLNSVKLRRLVVIVASIGILVFAAVGYALRDNDHFQNVFFHTNEYSQSAESSNAGHISAVNKGAKDIIQAPWGKGTGTAGPASVYNNGQTRIAENYYVQIGQEVGIVGLGLFVAINVLVVLRLWALRSVSTLAVVLLASFVGITIINMLMHAWTDDTLAYLWWGFAGAALMGRKSTQSEVHPVVSR